MADVTPTYYDINPLGQNGMLAMADVVKSLYNLNAAVYEICNHLDVDNSTLGTDFLADIGTNLKAAMANLRTPTGPSRP